jgi:hypothetical protein
MTWSSMLKPCVGAIAITLCLAAAPASATPAKRAFFEGAAGTIPPNPKDRARTYFDLPQVRDLVERLEGGPAGERAVAARLAGSGATIADLVRTRIVRATPAGYVIGFNYFTLDDMRKIHATAEQYVPSLVQSYLKHAADFDRILSRYPIRSVPRKRLATVVLAGFALNWDGLDTTMRWGYRRPQLVTGPGWKYSFFASEADPSFSEHGFIWGSSSLFGLHDNLTQRPVDFEFSSFGDPYSDPRMNLPDVFFMSPGDLTADVAAAVRAIGTRNETYQGTELTAVLGPSRAHSLGPMLFGLRRHPLSARALAALVEPQDRAHAGSVIALLTAMEYIRRRPDGRYELITPVLDRADKPMLDAALSLHRAILSSWLKQNYPKMRAQLSSLTAVRQGVPFESTFTQIWHEYFGLATREMITSKLIEDPYSPRRIHRGSVAALWRRSLYHFDPG